MQSAFLVAASILASGAGTARAGFVSGLYNTGALLHEGLCRDDGLQ